MRSLSADNKEQAVSFLRFITRFEEQGRDSRGLPSLRESITQVYCCRMCALVTYKYSKQTRALNIQRSCHDLLNLESQRLIYCTLKLGASLVAQRLKCLPAMRETWVRSLGWEDPLEKEMATHSSVLAWRIPGTGEPGGLPSMGSHRVGHN